MLQRSIWPLDSSSWVAQILRHRSHRSAAVCIRHAHMYAVCIHHPLMYAVCIRHPHMYTSRPDVRMYVCTWAKTILCCCAWLRLTVVTGVNEHVRMPCINIQYTDTRVVRVLCVWIGRNHTFAVFMCGRFGFSVACFLFSAFERIIFRYLRDQQICFQHIYQIHPCMCVSVHTHTHTHTKCVYKSPYIHTRTHTHMHMWAHVRTSCFESFADLTWFTHK